MLPSRHQMLYPTYFIISENVLPFLGLNASLQMGLVPLSKEVRQVSSSIALDFAQQIKTEYSDFCR